MSSELTTGDKMLFMTVNSLVVCCSFGFTAFGFMSAVYAMLARKVWCGAERCGLLSVVRSGEDVSHNLITGQVMSCSRTPEQEVRYNDSLISSPVNLASYKNSRSSSPFLNPVRYNNSSSCPEFREF
ncbi:hypothetical protein SUGI_0028920 [Cryptomeria japonica]|nr:hypothetical protein SUGI_0028920 [Cryptomeria japonica]